MINTKNSFSNGCYCYKQTILLQRAMRKKVLIQSLKWFLPLLFITFINGKSLFIHSHLVKGILVVHSHPFDKNEGATHEHTTKELIAIEFHTHSHSTANIVSFVDIKSPLKYIDYHNYTNEETIYFSEKVTSNLLRAPPNNA